GGFDEWPFYARAGRSYTIQVDPGSAGELTPVAPQLGWAQVQVLDADGHVLGTASSTSAGAIATLSGISVPADGTYRIQVRAAAGHASATGNYLVTAWDVTPHISTLALNQPLTGEIEAPFSVDQWNFTGAAGQQVRFRLLNSISPGLRFSLSGPAGFTGFTDIAGTSSLIDLTASGPYTLTVRGVNAEDAAYAFQLDQTQQTALALGTPYDGMLAGDGEAQLFTVDVPQARQFLVSLQGITS